MASCDCHVEATDASQKTILGKLLALNAAMFVAELIVGIIAQSTGVLADSLDMLADALVYSVALYAIGRGPNAKTRAAYLSGAFQMMIALGMGADIVRRTLSGSDPSSLLMFLVSLVALGVNIWCLKLISTEKEGEVHMRASYVFSKNDVIANSGVILASAIIFFTGSRWPDLIVGSIITAVVLRGGIHILLDAKRENNAAPTQNDSAN